MPGFITEQQAEESLHWMISQAAALGEAVRLERTTEGLISISEALEMKAAEGSDAKRKETARASERYRRAVYANAEAAGKLAELRMLRDGHQARLDAWRSQSATLRAEKL